MKLEDLKRLFGEAIENAHLLVAGSIKIERVHSVSLRLDSDGVMSVILHTGHTQSRKETDESLHLKNALELYEYFDKTKAKDIEDCYVDWEILEAALDSYGCPEDPDEYDVKKIPDRITELLKDRNSLAEEIEKLKKELQAPKPKEDPKKNSKEKKVDKPKVLKPAEIDAARSKVFDLVSKTQPTSIIKISESLGISYDQVEQVLNHEWFEKRRSSWYIALAKIG